MPFRLFSSLIVSTLIIVRRMKIIKWLFLGILSSITGYFGTAYAADKFGEFPTGANLQVLQTSAFWKTVGLVGAVMGVLLFALRKNLRQFVGLGCMAGLSVLLGEALAVEGIAYASVLFTIAASSTETKTIQYLPEFLVFEAATVPTQLQVSVNGKALSVDLDGNGIQLVNQWQKKGQTGNLYLIPVADGELRGVNVEITIANALASTLTVFGGSTRPATRIMSHLRTTVLANSGITLSPGFLYSLQTSGANDIFDVVFANGFQKQFRETELRAWSTYRQENAEIMVDNTDGQIRSLTLTPSADRTVYISSMQQIPA